MIRLDTPMDGQIYQDYFSDIPADPVTVMNGKRGRALNTIGTPVLYSTPGLMEDTNPQTYGYPTDGGGVSVPAGALEDTEPRPYGSPADYFFQTSAPTTEVPILLSQPMTNKEGTTAVPIDATLYNNPATEGLFTLQLPGSPLIANLQDNPGSLSGSDPMPSMGTAQTFADTPPEMDTTETDNVNIAPGINIKKSVLKETGIFVIGALILVVGIYAMTR